MPKCASISSSRRTRPSRAAASGSSRPGSTSDTRDRARRPLVSSRTAYWITDILSDNDAREFIFGRGGSLEFPFAVAVKTGTSQAYHDNWTVGYTRDVTVGVWVGNFNRAPLRSSSGVTGAAPIFHAVMLAATRRQQGSAFAIGAIASAPEGLVAPRRVRPLGHAGERLVSVTPARVARPGDTADDRPCSWHHQSDEGVLVFWPPEYRQWAKQNGLLTAGGSGGRGVGGSRISAWSESAGRPSVRGSELEAFDARTTRSALGIVNPPSGGVYLIDPTLRREFQTLALRAVAARSRPDRVVDRRPRRRHRVIESPLEWPLAPGAHRITARDGLGNVAESTVTVK